MHKHESKSFNLDYQIQGQPKKKVMKAESQMKIKIYDYNFDTRLIWILFEHAYLIALLFDKIWTSTSGSPFAHNLSTLNYLHKPRKNNNATIITPDHTISHYIASPHESTHHESHSFHFRNGDLRNFSFNKPRNFRQKTVNP